MGAEAPVADPDAELGAEAGGHQPVMHSFDSEGRHRKRVGTWTGGRSQDMHAVEGSQPLV